MISVLHWKKKFFDQVTTIHSADGEIGRLEENSWKQTAHGEINNWKFTYRTRGIFKPYTEILDPVTKHPLGKIEYNAWRNKFSPTWVKASTGNMIIPGRPAGVSLTAMEERSVSREVRKKGALRVLI